MIGWITAIILITALLTALVSVTGDSRHGPEVDDLDATLGRPEMPNTAVPLTDPGPGYRGGHRRRG